MADLRFLSLNMNGFFGDPARTLCFTETIKEHDIVFLQELKLQEKDCAEFEAKVSEGTSGQFSLHYAINMHREEGQHKNGVAILVRKSLNTQPLGIDPYGRYVSVDLKVGEAYRRFICTYCPVLTH